ncbi:MAG: class A beta-lactamase [Bradyrhizobium sp.]|nr:MAG: class A beta-lactamase [Bradyrhizobium sp.]
MPVLVPRRAFLAGVAAAAFTAPARADDSTASAEALIAVIEQAAGGRLGVAVIDSGSKRSIGHRADERFPMCSTFKVLAAGAVLKRVDAGTERLDRRLPYGPSDLLDYAPIAKSHVGEGAMSLADACAAAIQWSDNTAANLVLATIGGPAGVTDFARSLGDVVTRLDRNEPSLNSAIPGDPRDTTSPYAMARDLQALLLGDALSEASRKQLEAWMVGNQTGGPRLRAGLPADWGIGDKTGSGDHGVANTIAILRPPGRAPLFVAVYYAESDRSMDDRNAVNRDVALVIAAAM